MDLISMGIRLNQQERQITKEELVKVDGVRKAQISRLEKSALFILIMLTAFCSSAQKLPNIQRESLYAPITIKIDGKATEWNDKFQAYNHNIETFYTISNDKDNLYIILQAKDQDVIRKIVTGGVEFSFSSVNKKEKATIISYPFYDKLNLPLTLNGLKKNDKNEMYSDSIVNINNYKLQTRLKLLGVRGIKEIQDSILSIYNLEGIKAAMLLNNKLELTYELALPLKYLVNNLNINQIYYTIKLNSIYRNMSNINTVKSANGDRIISTGTDGKSYVLGSANSQNIFLSFPTSFAGEYKLSKK